MVCACVCVLIFVGLLVMVRTCVCVCVALCRSLRRGRFELKKRLERLGLLGSKGKKREFLGFWDLGEMGF